MNRPLPGPGHLRAIPPDTGPQVPALVPLPTAAPAPVPIAAELISAHSPVVADVGDVPVTGDRAVDAAMDHLRALLSGDRAGEDVAVLTGVHEALARRLGDAAR